MISPVCYLPYDWRIGRGYGISCYPLYIAEVSPKDLRGRMLGMQQMLMVGGQLVVYIVNYLIARGMAHEWVVSMGWRWMLASALIPCVLFLVMAFFMPESPRWYAMRNQREKSLKVLTSLSNPDMPSVYMLIFASPSPPILLCRVHQHLMAFCGIKIVLHPVDRLRYRRLTAGLRHQYPDVLCAFTSTKRYRKHTGFPLSEYFPWPRTIGWSEHCAGGL